MACACKVKQEIEKINKYYSYNDKIRKSNEKNKMSINKKEAVETMLIYLLLLPLLPIMLIGVLVFSFTSSDKMISMRKFLGFIHNIRNGR